MDILAKNLLILASAGSGKTFQLSNRIIGLIAKGSEPEQVVALTFTRKAAAEFADSMLMKLANATTDESAAATLRSELDLPDADFNKVLGQVARSLHRITLGTMDSFFAKVVRGFQYELGLTGGKFDLVEGPQAEIVADEILTGILGNVMSSAQGEPFFHAFRRANIGKEQQGIAKSLREFIRDWHQRYRHHPNLTWGPDHLTKLQPGDWEKHKHALASQALDGIDSITFTRKGQREALEKSIHALRDHSLGSGSLGSSSTPSLAQAILEAAATQSGEALTLKFYKEFEVHGPCATALREMARLAAECELAAAIERTRAIREVIESYDAHCATRLRNHGRLGFDDIKLLMGEWASSETARLRREAIDFRLDSRYHHWLLDEFQDTSRADWNGLFPLVDEAASDADKSVFIVGDRKQAIYAWRGGDVSLFGEVIDHYRDGMRIESLNESWRSSPEVLSLVNRVCGDKAATATLFGDAGAQWDCPEHVSAAPLCQPEQSGHAQVEVVGDWQERLDRMAEILGQLGVGKRQMTCGVLLRGNSKAEEVAHDLRNRGFDVILEGQRVPGKDNPVGIVVTQLLKWLADPANRFALNTIVMSPLAGILHQQCGASWHEIWNDLSSRIASHGYRATIASLLDACPIKWSEFGQRRADDVLHALGEFDQQGGVSAAQAANLLDRLTVSQSPGMAAIQVMTIHKSKGLGFDVVILPEIPADKIPSAQYYNVVFGDGWLCQTPPQWARAFISDLTQNEKRWSTAQQYEALCTLYVALTRAKRGLYVLLDTPKSNHDFDKPSLANWIFQTTGGNPEEPGVIYEVGNLEWSQDLKPLEEENPAGISRTLTDPGTASHDRCLTRVLPSRMHAHGTHSISGMQFGLEVHALLESIPWIDDGIPPLPDTPAAKTVRQMLEQPDTREIFRRQQRDIQLLREQAIDAVIGERWISGVIDRLHLHRNPQGEVVAAEIIDFKTDAIDKPEALIAAYHDQLDGYRTCIQQLYPQATITCSLLSTHLGKLVNAY